MKVLLIEPDFILAGVYKDALEEKGFRVEVTNNAQSAITAADKTTPDLVVLEIQLVEHSGIEFLYEFRSYSEWQKIPVLIHSHIPPSEFAGNLDILSNELGVDVYLYKPKTNLRQLIASIKQLGPVNA